MLAHPVDHTFYFGGGLIGTTFLVFVVQLAGLAIVPLLLATSRQPDVGGERPLAADTRLNGRTAGAVAFAGVAALMPLVVRASETFDAEFLRRPELAAGIVIAAIGLSPMVLMPLASAVGLARGRMWARDVAAVTLVSAWIVVVPLGLMAGLAGLVGDFELIRRGALIAWFVVAAVLLVAGPSSLALLVRGRPAN